MWCIWREINGRIFVDCERMVVELKAFFNTLYQWTIAYDFVHIFSFHDFIFYILYFFLFCLGICNTLVPHLEDEE